MNPSSPLIETAGRQAGKRRTAIAALVRIADLAGTFVFAIEGALAAAQAHFDPVGMLALAFVVALGGGVLRDAMLGLRAAAVADWRYAAIVIGASMATWLLQPIVPPVPGWSINVLDAAGLALFVVAGTDKALANGVHPLPACFLGTLGAVGGGVIRDVLLGGVPHILFTDIYASAAFLGAAIVALGRRRTDRARGIAVIGGIACFAIRIAAYTFGWHLPRFFG